MNSKILKKILSVIIILILSYVTFLLWIGAVLSGHGSVLSPILFSIYISIVIIIVMLNLSKKKYLYIPILVTFISVISFTAYSIYNHYNEPNQNLEEVHQEK